MKTYKVFKREEIQNALERGGFYGEVFFELLDNFCNDVAVHWWVEYPDRDDYPAVNIINMYLINQGCSVGEMVYIDVTW